MAIDLFSEELIPLRTASRRLPRPVCYQTLKNWSQKGLKDGRGKRVYLEIVRHGRELCTSMEAYIRFTTKLKVGRRER